MSLYNASSAHSVLNVYKDSDAYTDGNNVCKVYGGTGRCGTARTMELRGNSVCYASNAFNVCFYVGEDAYNADDA